MKKINIAKYYKYLILLVVILIILIIIYAINKDNEVSNNQIEENIIEEEETTNEIKTVYVDIKGAVNKPGVYEVEDNKRIIDQTCTIMIQKLNLLFARNPLNIKGI